ncbi:nucleotidyltransferase domain-containing protein [Paraburkholderia sp. UCT31]|uniref:nucleotidyltransferase family protein n=1 Tax=Paraburkholderia sp. UCT31 TaxID=2615209 RepID=UPI0016563CB0|nr:nucleotidyltransferase domain-containing protein [Paraburkholderia sp. UCT31]MBC8741898.1 nucleotidyltransferase domain-containing protein [Paraburkholderia sp. UCT31]
MSSFEVPTQREIVDILKNHPLVRLRKDVVRAFLVGSFATGRSHAESDVDILLEVRPSPGRTAAELEDYYRQGLRDYFVKHDIRGKQDSLHPNWCGRRVDVYFTYNADQESRPKVRLAP